MTKECDFLIIGAGIGGASTGYFLSETHKVILLEMEDQPGYHTTGRSIAVYTEAYGPRTIRALARSGHGFFTRPPAGFTDVPLARPQGFLFVARSDQREALQKMLKAAQELSPDNHAVSADDAVKMVPVLRRDYLDSTFLDPTAMALDVAAIHQGYLRGLRSNGGQIVCKAEAMKVERKGGKWHVTTPAGTFSAPVVINAAGAWADQIGARFGAKSIGLQPMRRTAIAFVPPNVPVDNDWPVVIDVNEDWYFKVDAGTVLGSLADETPSEPVDAQPEEIDIATTVDRIERASTMQIKRIQRSWAGLRSFVADRSTVTGYDPDIEGFYWCAGQGGYGIETSNGMGRVTAALARGEAVPADIRALGVTEADLGPERLWKNGPAVKPAPLAGH
ncbi:MAG: FAD-binding oxidoreductase [Hyphomicrobiaceae bacterium]